MKQKKNGEWKLCRIIDVWYPLKKMENNIIFREKEKGREVTIITSREEEETRKLHRPPVKYLLHKT